MCVLQGVTKQALPSALVAHMDVIVVRWDADGGGGHRFAVARLQDLFLTSCLAHLISHVSVSLSLGRRDQASPADSPASIPLPPRHGDRAYQLAPAEPLTKPPPTS